MGSGNLIDRVSMENTYGQMREAEGQKQGYLNALSVLAQLQKHEVVEDGVQIDMPDMETILEKA